MSSQPEPTAELTTAEAPNAPTLRSVEVAVPRIEDALGIGVPPSPSAEVVLITHNSASELAHSLPAIREAAAAAGAPLLVADLGSTDGTREQLAAEVPGARAAWLEPNDGLEAVLSTAAACSDAEVLVILRPALEPAQPDQIARLIAHLEEHPYVAAAAPALHGSGGSPLRSAGRASTRGQHRCVEWVLDDAIAIRRSDAAEIGERGIRASRRFDALELCAELRREGREIHYLEEVRWLDAHAHAAPRIELTARAWSSTWRLLARRPAHALRLLATGATARSAYAILSRAVDVALATALLLMLAPLLLAIALAVRLDSGGPALFRQRRLGQDARPFEMYKFRTMRRDADHAPHEQFVRQMIETGVASVEKEPQVFKIHPDPRVTRVGRLLRRSSFDELPQLLNVLRGEMSLVGFRPPIPYELASYPSWYFRRFDGKPGVTGLWQVSGRNERSYDEMIRLDIEYANRRSWLLDLSVLVRTVGAVVSGRGAY